ncbi:alkaline phosphatase D family protein [soil metagenome]
MGELIIGPLLRYVGETEATIWVETSEPCEVEVLNGATKTFEVSGHHYALIQIDRLEPGSINEYEVKLDGVRCWPLPESKFPASVIRTLRPDGREEIVFGSCRVGFPHEKPFVLPKDQHEDGREYDALNAKAYELAELEPWDRPSLMILLGDQVYADDVSPEAREFIASRRDTSKPPGKEVADFEEYCRLYWDSWGDEAIRWLLSTVSSSMIWDDHDVNDDWNISASWLADMRETDWWQERVESAYMSYWIYQHAGNLSPDELAEDETWAIIEGTEGDAGPALREWAKKAEASAEGSRWSYYRDIGRTRIVVMDSRAGRVLEKGRRSMFDDKEWDWITEHARGDFDHLLLGTTLPMLLAPGLQSFEAWNEKLCESENSFVAENSEKLRQALDMEHWGAFSNSFEKLAELLREIGSSENAPASITVLSGDVHHAYLAEVGFPKGSGVRSAVYQAVCSPFRNPLNRRERTMMKVAHSSAARVLARGLARSAGIADPPIGWRFLECPYFDNQAATITLDGREAEMKLEKTRRDDADTAGPPSLECVFEHQLS